ncbi:hypothetical protein ACPB4E_20115 [Escherichia coli]
MSIKNDGHYFCRAGGNRPDGLNEPVTHFLSNAEMCQHLAGEWDSSLPEKDKRDIEKGVDTWCPPAKKSLPVLREKYKENKEIIKILSAYDF